MHRIADLKKYAKATAGGPALIVPPAPAFAPPRMTRRQKIVLFGRVVKFVGGRVAQAAGRNVKSYVPMILAGAGLGVGIAEAKTG